MPKTKEQVYDDVISPLMYQIIKACHDAGIDFVVDFKLDDNLHCSTVIIQDRANAFHVQLAMLLKVPKEDWLSPEQAQSYVKGH